MFCFLAKFYRVVPNRSFYYAREISIKSDARTTILKGIDSFAKTVPVILPPRTQNDVLDHILKKTAILEEKRLDAVAEAIELQNQLKNVGSKLLAELSFKKDEEPDKEDSSATSTILARTIAEGSIKKISAGANPNEIRRGVILAINAVKKYLKTISRSIINENEIEKVANIYSSNDPTVTKIVCDAIKKVNNRDGIISVRKGEGHSDEVEVVRGIKIDCGFVSPFFINTPNSKEVDFQNPLIFLCARRITAKETIMPVLELANAKGAPLVIIADCISGEALKALLLKRMTLGLPIAAVKAPGYGENKKAILRDIAIATGGMVFEDRESKLRMNDVKLSDFGKVSNVIISKDATLLLKGSGKPEQIEQRIEEIKGQISEATIPLKKKCLRERLSNLVSGIVLVNVGGNNEFQINNKIESIKSAIHATRAAMEEGIVPGSGIALLKCIPLLEKLEGFNDMQRMGIEIVRHALRVPYMSIAEMAGVDADFMSYLVNENDYWESNTAGGFGNFLEMAMIEPTKILRSEITDAAGVASLLIASNATKLNYNEKN